MRKGPHVSLSSLVIHQTHLLTWDLTTFSCALPHCSFGGHRGSEFGIAILIRQLGKLRLGQASGLPTSPTALCSQLKVCAALAKFTNSDQGLRWLLIEQNAGQK